VPNVNQKESVARKVRHRVLRSHDQHWSADDFPSDQHLAASVELRRLASRGELNRVRRGLYWRGTHSRFGRSPAQPDRALQELMEDEAVGASGWYASNLLGLSTQVAPIQPLAVTGRPPEGLSHVKIVNRAGRRGRRRERLTELEITFLEALEGWDRYVEADATVALDRFAQLLESDDIRADRLVRASKTEPAAVRERLRAVLLHAGLEAEAENVPPARDPRTRARALSVLGGRR
jgi:hypothetical protein